MESTSGTRSSKRTRTSPSPETEDTYGRGMMSQPAPNPRTRGATACQRCRSRKTKCNNLQPCAYCSKIDALCVYDEEMSLDTTTGVQILDAISKLSKLVEKQQIQCSECSELLPRDSGARTGTFGEDDGSTSLASPTAWVNYGLFVKHSNPVGPFGGIVQPILRAQGIESVLKWSTFTDIQAEGPLFTGESWPAEQNVTLPSIRPDELLRLYEKYRIGFHSKNPILDLDELRMLMLNLAENGFDWSTATCLVALVCAIGAVHQQYQDQHLSPSNHMTPGAHQPLSPVDDLCGSEPRLSLQFWHVAVKRLGGAIGQGDIQAAQCLCLAGMYYMHHLEPLQAWKYFNLAGSVWYSLKLVDYASGRRSSLYVEEKSVTVTQALYFTIWKSICELRMEIDVPGVFDDVGLPHEFPLAPNLGTIGPITNPNGDEKYWFFYLAEIAARHQINRIASSMTFTPVAPTSKDIRKMLALADMFERNLYDWHASLPPMFGFDVPTGYNIGPHPDDHIQILRHRFLACKELIGRPFVRLCVETPLSYEEPLRGHVLQKASVCLQYCMLKLSQVAPHRHQGTWYGLRNAAISILILCSVELAHRSLTTSRDLSLPDGWQALAARVTDTLGPLYSEYKGGASTIGRLVRSALAAASTP